MHNESSSAVFAASIPLSAYLPIHLSLCTIPRISLRVSRYCRNDLCTMGIDGGGGFRLALGGGREGCFVYADAR